MVCHRVTLPNYIITNTSNTGSGGGDAESPRAGRAPNAAAAPAPPRARPGAGAVPRARRYLPVILRMNVTIVLLGYE